MIAANEAVAGLLEQRAIPCLYRVHERPDPQRIERLVEQLASLEVPTPALPEPLSSTQAADLVGEISRLRRAPRAAHRPRAIALESLVLRSLKQAYYSPRNLGHAGLHSPRYCHFTSPIRRYPDLVCHRALLSAVGGGEQAPRRERARRARRVDVRTRARRGAVRSATPTTSRAASRSSASSTRRVPSMCSPARSRD